MMKILGNMVFRRVLFFVMILTLVGCSDSPSDSLHLNGRWQEAGLLGLEINTLNANEGVVFAGTHRGAFNRSDFSIQTKWESIGLNTDSTQVIDFVVWNKNKLLSVIKYDNFRPENPVLFESKNGGSSWTADYTTAIEKVQRFAITGIEKNPNNPSKLVAYRGHIIQSADSGATWNVIFDKGSIPEFLVVSPYYPKQIWTGGGTNLFSPYLAMSKDEGKTWTILNQKVYSGSDGTCYDALVDASNPDRVLIALYGIMRSEDGGGDWQQVFNRATITTLTHSARDPDVVYSSGQNAAGTLFFAVSNDFGDTWKTIEMQDSPTGIRTNDLAAVIMDGKEVLLLGTNKGVYSYHFEE